MQNRKLVMMIGK